MYSIFELRAPDYSNLVMEKVDFNLSNATVTVVGKVHRYFDQGNLNGPLESDIKI